jgi:hypothetical protein
VNAVNRAVPSDLIAAEPPDRSRDVDPITVLLLMYTTPDERMGTTSTCRGVEVRDSIAGRHRRRLRTGQRAWLAGHLTSDGLWATSLGTWMLDVVGHARRRSRRSREDA